jgi:NAD(P)H-hydrate epimerase
MLRLTRSQLREIDRLSTERYHIPGIVLMENAARGAADVASDMLGPAPGKSVLIVCGGGNNGGDGLAAARHLHNRGHRVSIALTIDPAQYKSDALTHWQIASAMNLPCHPATPELLASARADLLLDAIFGTGLTNAPRHPFPALVDAIAHSQIPVLSIDLPSGLDCDTGRPPGACIRATRTVTFVAEKTGFAAPEARPFLGDVTVAPIGCPANLIAEIAGLPPEQAWDVVDRT